MWTKNFICSTSNVTLCLKVIVFLTVLLLAQYCPYLACPKLINAHVGFHQITLTYLF